MPTQYATPLRTRSPLDFGNQTGGASGRFVPVKFGLGGDIANPNLNDQPATPAVVDQSQPVNPLINPPQPAQNPYEIGANPVQFTPPAPVAQDQIPDTDFAASAMAEFDNILASIGDSGSDGSYQASAEDAPNSVNPNFQSSISARPADRSWMFRQRPGWDSATRGSRNYTPAPVEFNNTNSNDWGTTALDQRPSNNGPAPSTVRYYQRALDRAWAGSRPDVRRINRLQQRIDARPTNEDDTNG